MRKLFVLAILAVLVVAFSCNHKETGQNGKEPSVMYEPTELALLMLQMHDNSAEWKEAIKKDSFDITFPTDFYGIYTAEATDPNVRDERFKAMADVYLASLKDLIDTKKEKKLAKKFNLTIDACIACHSIYCQGPIDKIEQLYIAY